MSSEPTAMPAGGTGVGRAGAEVAAESAARRFSGVPASGSRGRVVGPLLALLWKEWREQRSIVVAGLAMSAGLPLLVLGLGSMSAGYSTRNFVEISAGLLVFLVWPFAAAAAGATVSPAERDEAALVFLLSRPVARGRLWVVKVVAGLLTATLVVVLSSLLGLALLYGVHGDRAGEFLGAIGSNGLTSLPSSGDVLYEVGYELGIPLLLVFACSVFVATVVTRPLAAAAGGVVGGLVVYSVIHFAWLQLIGARLERDVVVIEAAMAFAALLGASAWVHRRGELLRDRAARGAAWRAVGVAAVVFLVGATALAWGKTRVTEANVILRVEAFSREAGVVVLRADRANGGSRQIWALDLDGTLRRLTPRLTFGPAVAPDGEWIVYVSQRGWLGRAGLWLNSWLRWGWPYELRAIRPDGSGDRPLMAAAGGFRNTFSPDGRRLLITREQGVFDIVSLDGGEPQRLDVRRELPVWGVYWALGDRALVLDDRGVRRWPSIGIYDLESRSLRTHTMSEGWLLHVGVAGTGPFGSLVPVYGARRETEESSRRRRRYEYGVGLVDLENGEERLLADGIRCEPDATRLSPDERFLVYPECLESDFRLPQLDRLHVVDVETGEDRVVAEIRDGVRRVTFDPTGRRLLVRAGYFNRTDGSITVVDLDGGSRTFEGGWHPLGWLDERRAVLARYRELAPPYRDEALEQLVLADVETGEMTTVFPRPESR